MSIVDCKNYRALTFLVLISFSLISIPFVGSAADGYNPIEEHWVESGLVHIEHTTNETHSGVAIDAYLSSLDSIYDNPSLAVDESGILWLSYSNSGIIHVAKQNQDSFFKTVSAISDGMHLSEHHYSIVNGEHIIVAEGETENNIQGIIIFTSPNGADWENKSWITDSQNDPMNNPWLTKTGPYWTLYWDQPFGLHHSIFSSSSLDLVGWDTYTGGERGKLVFPEGTYSSQESHPTSVYIDGTETLVWTSDKFDNHEFMGSDVEKTLVFSQRSDAYEWSEPQPIANQFGNDENPSLSTINNNPVVVWDSDRSFDTSLEGEGMGHGGTNLWYSALLNQDWTEPACISIQEIHKSSPNIAYVDDLGVVVVWEENEQIHMTHTSSNDNSLPMLESFEKSFSLSDNSFNEEIHIDKPTRIHKEITITNDGDFVLRGDIESTNGLTISHHLIELYPGDSMSIQLSANLDPLDDYHGVITIDTNAGIKKVGVDFHTVDSNENQFQPLEELSEGNYSGIIKSESSSMVEDESDGYWLAILLVLAVCIFSAIGFKKHKDKKSHSSAPKAISMVGIMILMSFTAMIENTRAEEVPSPFLAEKEIYDWDIYPNQDFNLTWPVEVTEDNLIETTLTSKEYSNPPQALAKFPNCWDHCDQRLWELEILKQELSYDRWVNMNFEIKGSVDSYPFVIFQDKDNGKIEYYNLSSILGGITGKWQHVEFDLQSEGSFLSRSTGDANLYIVSPILGFDNPSYSASLVIKTIGQQLIPSELNSSLIPITYKEYFDSGNTLSSSKVVNGDIVDLVGSVHRFPVASFPTEAEPTYNYTIASEVTANLTESQLNEMDATIQNDTNFDIIIKEYENYKWFNSPTAQGDNSMPSSGWQECGDGGFLCPAGGELDSSSTSASSSPFVESDWLVGTYDSRYSQQYLSFEYELPAPQISSVLLNHNSDMNGNRLVDKDQTLEFDIRIQPTYQGIDSLTFEATVVNLDTQKALGVIARETVSGEELEKEYAKALTNEESNISFSFKPSDWYYPLPDDETRPDPQNPVFWPYGQYAIVVTYAAENLSMSDGNEYALGKWGVTDDGKHLIREELFGSLFVIQPGPVVTDAEIILPTYEHLKVSESTKVFILNAEDSVWDGVGNRYYSTKYFSEKLEFSNVDYSYLNSTSELEMLINSDIENAMIINTHGPILPAPTSYFTDNQKENGLLGEWNFEPFVNGTIVDQSSYLNNGELINGIRSYDSTQGAMSLFLNETSSVTIRDSGSSIVYELINATGVLVYCISDDGKEPNIQTSRCYRTGDDAQNVTSKSLYPVENYRVSLDLKFLAPHDSGSLSVMNYGELSNLADKESFWELKYDASKQELYLFSSFFEHEEGSPALTVSNVSEDLWYKLDLVFDELGVTIYLNAEKASQTAYWKNVEHLNQVKKSSITGFEIADSEINMLIDNLWISNKPSKPEASRSVTSVDITNSKNWVGRIGHWMAEESGIWVQPTGLAFSTISNTEVGWDDDKIEIGVQGLETFMQRFGAGTTEDIVIDDNDDPISWNNYEYCEWEGSHFAGGLRWYCMDDMSSETNIVDELNIVVGGSGYLNATGISLDSDTSKGEGLMIDITASDITHNMVEQISSDQDHRGSHYNKNHESQISTHNFGGTGKGLTVSFKASEIFHGKVDTFTTDLGASGGVFMTESNIVVDDTDPNHPFTVNLTATPYIQDMVSKFGNLNNGTGYTTTAGVATTSVGQGTGLTVDIVATQYLQGVVDTLDVLDAGTGYQNSTNVTTHDTTGRGNGLTVDIEVLAGSISSISVNQSGSGYHVNSSILIADGNWNAHYNVTSINSTGGVITNITINDNGSGYSVGDVINISTGNNDASINVTEIQSLGGEIISLEVNNVGQNYSVSDQFSVSQNSYNIPSSFTITVESIYSTGGHVSNISIDDPGSGYQVGDFIGILDQKHHAQQYWVNCGYENSIAHEHETCYFTGTKLVRYGIHNEDFHNWTYKYMTDGVICSNSVFGGPDYGSLKRCEVLHHSHELATFYVSSTINQGGEIQSVEINYGGSNYDYGENLTIPDGDQNAIINVSTYNMFDDWWYYCENGTNQSNASETMWYCTDDLGQEIFYENVSSDTLHLQTDTKFTKVISHFGNPNSDNFVDGLNWDLTKFLNRGQDSVGKYFNGNLTGHTVRTNIGMVDILSHEYLSSSSLEYLGRDSLTFYHPVQTGGLFYHGGVENQLDLIGDDVCNAIANCVDALGSIGYHLDIELVGHKSSSGKVVPGGTCNLQGWSNNYVGISNEDYEANRAAFEPGNKIYFQGNWYWIDGVDSPRNCNHPAKLIYVVREESKADGNIWTYEPNTLHNFVHAGSNWHVPSTLEEKIITDPNLTSVLDELDINVNDWKAYYEETLPFIWDYIEPLLEERPEVIYHIDVDGFSYSQFGNTLHEEGASSYEYQSSRSVVTSEVSDANDYALLYELNLGSGIFGFDEIIYDRDYSEHLNLDEVERVAYHLELKKPGEERTFVYVSIPVNPNWKNTPSYQGYESFSDLGIPNSHTWQYKSSTAPSVGNDYRNKDESITMNFASNDLNLRQQLTDGAVTVEDSNLGTNTYSGTSIASLEFWTNNYGGSNTDSGGHYQGNKIGDSSYDVNDNPDTSILNGYGSMQVHSSEASVTMFSYSGWATSNPDLGIGNRLDVNGVQHPIPDWTFANNIEDYDVKTLRVLVKMQNGDGVFDDLPIYSDSPNLLTMENFCENHDISLAYDCNSIEIVSKFSNNAIVMPVNSIDQLNHLMHSNVKGAYILNSHGDNLPIHSDYFTGIKPLTGHKFLYDFELSSIGEISNHIYDRSGNNADARLVHQGNFHSQSISDGISTLTMTLGSSNTGELVNDLTAPIGERYFSGTNGDSILTSPTDLKESFTIDFMVDIDSNDIPDVSSGTNILTTVYQTSTCMDSCWYRSLSEGGASHSESNGLPSVHVKSDSSDDSKLEIHFVVGNDLIVASGVESGWNHLTISKSHDNKYSFYVNSLLVESIEIATPNIYPTETSLLFGTSNNIPVGIEHISVSNMISQDEIARESVDYISWLEQFGQLIHSGNTLLDIGGAQLSRAQGIDTTGRILPLFSTEESLTTEICVYNARFPANVERNSDGSVVMRDSLSSQSRTLLVKDWHNQGYCHTSDQFAVENKIDSTHKLNVFDEQFEGTIPYCVANLVSNSYTNHYAGGHENIPVLAGENLSSLIFPNTETCTNPMGIWQQSFVFYAFDTNQGVWTTANSVCVSDNAGIIITEQMNSYEETRIMVLADSGEDCTTAESGEPMINLDRKWVHGFDFYTSDSKIMNSGLSYAFSEYLPDIYRHNTHSEVDAIIDQDVRSELDITISNVGVSCEIQYTEDPFSSKGYSNYWSINPDCYNEAGRPQGSGISVKYTTPDGGSSEEIPMKLWSHYATHEDGRWGEMEGMPGGRVLAHPSSFDFQVGGTLEFSFSSGAHGTLWTPNEMTFAIPLIHNDTAGGHYLIEGVIPVGSGCIISSTTGDSSLVEAMGSWCRNENPRLLYNLGASPQTITYPPGESTYYHEVDVGVDGDMILQMLETHSDGNIVFNQQGNTLPMPNELFENDLIHDAITMAVSSDPSYEPSNKYTANRIHSAIFSDAPAYLCNEDELKYSMSTPFSSYNQYLDTTTNDDMRPQVYLELEYELIQLGEQQTCGLNAFESYIGSNSVGITKAASESSKFRYSLTDKSAPACTHSRVDSAELGILTSRIRGESLSSSILSESFNDANEIKNTEIRACMSSNQMIRVVNWALTFGNDHMHGHWEATISDVNIVRANNTVTYISESLMNSISSDILGIKPYHGLVSASVGYDDSKTIIQSHDFMSYVGDYISDLSSFISRNGHAYYGHLESSQMPFEYIDVYDQNDKKTQVSLNSYGWSEFLEPRTDAHHLMWDISLAEIENRSNHLDSNGIENLTLDPIPTGAAGASTTLWIQDNDKDVVPYSSADLTAVQDQHYSSHAWIRLGHGSVIHSGNSSIVTAMDMASEFVNSRNQIINNRAGEYSKGQTIFIEVQLNNFMSRDYGDLLNVSVYMNAKSLAGGAVSERIVTHKNAEPMLINQNTTLTLAWNIHENTKIGAYTFSFDVINTDTNKYIDTYGQNIEDKIGVSVISDVQILSINRKVTTGIFDEVEINIDLRNNMYVETEILGQAIFTAENKHMYWSDEFTNTCESSSHCKMDIFWDPAAQNYHNQSFNIGTFTGKVFIEDAVSKYITESSEVTDGHPSYIRTPAIIDLDHFEIELLPEFEVIFPNVDALWKYKFDDDNAWTYVGRNYKLSTQKDISSLQIMKVSDFILPSSDIEIFHQRDDNWWGISQEYIVDSSSSTNYWETNVIVTGVILETISTCSNCQSEGRTQAKNKLQDNYTNYNFSSHFHEITSESDNFIEMRYSTSTPTALRLTYAIETEVSINETSNKMVTQSFSSDGSSYRVSHYALLDNSSISISTEPYFTIATHTFTGDMSAYGATNTFDRHYDELPNSLRFVVRAASIHDMNQDNKWHGYLGKGFSLDISEKGYYKLQLTGSTVDNHKLVILSDSYWDSNSIVPDGTRNVGNNVDEPRAIEITDADWDDKSKVKFSTEMHGNNPVTLPLYPGNYYFLILTDCKGTQTGIPCDMDPVNVTNALTSFKLLKFQKIAQLDIESKEGCPGIGYSSAEANARIDALEKVGVTDCVRPPPSHGHDHDKSQSNSVGTSALGPTGATASSLPAGGPNILDELTKMVHIPLFGANADSSGPSFEHSFGSFAAVSASIDWVEEWDSDDADGTPMESNLRLRMSLSGEVELEETGVVVTYSLTVDVILMHQFFALAECHKGQLIYICDNLIESIPHMGEYVAFNVEFDLGIEIPIGRYIWGEPIDIEVEVDGKTFFEIKLEIYINIEVKVDVYNKNLCELKKEAFDADLKLSDIPSHIRDGYLYEAYVFAAYGNWHLYEYFKSGAGQKQLYSDMIYPCDHIESVGLRVEFSLGVRLSFEFTMNFRIGHIYNDLTGQVVVKNNEKVIYGQEAHAAKISAEDAESKKHKWVEKEHSKENNFETRKSLNDDYAKRMGSSNNKLKHATKSSEALQNKLSSVEKSFNESEKYWKMFKSAKWVNFDGDFSLGFEIGITIHVVIECDGTPCKSTVDISFFLHFTASAHFKVWFFHVGIDLDLTINKVVWAVQIGGQKGWKVDPTFGTIMFCDKGYDGWGYPADASEWISTSPSWAEDKSKLKITAAGFIHINIGIPNFGCFKG